MDSSDDDGDENFDLDSQWIDGEFVQSKKRRRQTKEEMIYGYDDNISDEEYKNYNAKPVSFISSGHLNESKDKIHSEKKSNFVPSSSNNSFPNIPTSFSSTPQIREKNKPKNTPKTNKKNIKEDYGMGMTLLNKMGFKGRLGKKEDGISAPIEVQPRPKNVGLGMVSEKVQHPDDNLKKTEEQEKNLISIRKTEHQKWKKERKQPKIIYRSANDLIKESINQSPMIIYDMTGKTTRVTTIDKLKNLEYESEEILPELQFNLQAIVEMTETDIINFDKKRKQHKEEQEKLHKERDLLKNAIMNGNDSIQRLEEIIKKVEQCSDVIQNIDNPNLSITNLVNLFEEMNQKYHQEYQLYGLGSLAIAIAFPYLKKILSSWTPLSEPDKYLQELIRWKMILSGLSSKQMNFSNCGNVFIRLQEEIILPPVRSALINEWDTKNPEPALKLIECVKPLFSQKVFNNLLEHTIIVRLKSSINTWNPRSDTLPVHLWLHPWLPWLSNILEPIYQIIRQKIIDSLGDWQVVDASVFSLINPWKTIWTENQMHSLLNKCILPKLKRSLREFMIDPRQQEVKTLAAIMVWQPLFPLSLFIKIFKKEFFPKWFNALYYWLNNSPDYSEISEWYLGWKNFFPENFRKHPSIELQFNNGLLLMNASVNDENLNPIMIEIMNQLREEGHSKIPSITEVPPSIVPDTSNIEYDFSFKDIIEKFAQKHGITFQLNLSRGLYEGKQIFLFGKTNIFLENDCIYAQTTKKNWQPIPLDELLKLNQDLNTIPSNIDKDKEKISHKPSQFFFPRSSVGGFSTNAPHFK